MPLKEKCGNHYKKKEKEKVECTLQIIVLKQSPKKLGPL